MPHLTYILRFLRWLSALVLITLLLAGGVLALLLQSAPQQGLTPGQGFAPGGAALQKLVDRPRLKSVIHGHPVAFRLGAADLSPALSDLAWRTFAGAGRVNTTDQGTAQAWLSLPIQRTPLRALSPLGAWLNVQGEVTQTAKGAPQLTRLQVGHVSVPPGLALWLAQQVAAHYAVQEHIQIGLQAVQNVRINAREVTLSLHWDATLKERTLAALVPPEDRLRVKAYQAELGRVLPNTPQMPDWQRYLAVPLSKVLQPIFLLAQQRSVASMLAEQDADPRNDPAALENRAALLALSLYVMQDQIDQLAPTGLSTGQSQAPGRKLRNRRLTLQGREDFAQHFLLSALMASGVGGRLTDLVGTYKEMADETGGSGFSFNDLAADRAGVRFGQRALHEPLALQKRTIDGIDDGHFMPDVADLPEFLTPEQFKARFGAVGSPAYNALINEIEKRVGHVGVLTGS